MMQYLLCIPCNEPFDMTSGQPVWVFLMADADVGESRLLKSFLLHFYILQCNDNEGQQG